MPMVLLAAMMMAQAPAAAQPSAVQPAVAAKKKKAPQVCEYLEVTGSRSKRRVCRDESGNLDLGPGVSNNAYGKARIDPQNTAVTGGPGGSN